MVVSLTWGDGRTRAFEGVSAVAVVLDPVGFRSITTAVVTMTLDGGTPETYGGVYEVRVDKVPRPGDAA